jgi:hypothetical protein
MCRAKGTHNDTIYKQVNNTNVKIIQEKRREHDLGCGEILNYRPT